MSIPADYELCLRIREGDEWAFGELLRRYEGMMSLRVSEFFEVRGEERDDMEQVAREGLLKAARTFRPDRGTVFSTFARYVVHMELITAIKTAHRRKHEMLNRSERWEQLVGDGIELGEVASDPTNRQDPLEQVIARETFHSQVRVLTEGCSEVERTVVARVFNGLSLVDAGRGLGTAANPAKTADNALCRVRAKLAAAA